MCEALPAPGPTPHRRVHSCSHAHTHVTHAPPHKKATYVPSFSSTSYFFSRSERLCLGKYEDSLLMTFFIFTQVRAHAGTQRFRQANPDDFSMAAGMPTYKVRYAHIRASVFGAHAVAGRRVRATTYRRHRGDRSRDLHVIACAESLHHRASTSTSPRRRRDGIRISLPQERRGASGAGGGEDVQISRREPLTTDFKPGHSAAAHGRVSAAASGTCTMLG
jgi:hypothetical protein